MKYFTFLKKGTSKSSTKSKKKDELVLLKCQNCGTQMDGPYCHICGQSLFAGKESFIENFFSNTLSLYAVDFKIFRTIKLLLFYPGKLTKEYCQGHIIRYEHPFKLFWFVALLFFIYFSYKFDPNTTKLTGDVEFNRLFMSYLPYATLLLIPLFSFLLFVCFRKYEPRYSNHTVFALHFHTFLYVFFAGALFVSNLEISIKWWLLFLIPYIYLMIAVYLFYKPTIIPTILKILFILTAHILTMYALLFGLIILINFGAKYFNPQ